MSKENFKYMMGCIILLLLVNLGLQIYSLYNKDNDKKERYDFPYGATATPCTNVTCFYTGGSCSGCIDPQGNVGSQCCR